MLEGDGMILFLARFLTLSLLKKIEDFVFKRGGMIFFPSLLLYFTDYWKIHFAYLTLTFSRHIVCALIAKISKSEYEFRKEYFTGFT
ncbi:MAG: hypothetical protein WBN42_05065 [Ignavibacteriaceae bacterium]